LSLFEKRFDASGPLKH